ncbi:MAG: hypothetical protein B7Z08_12565 [Sphingomonadales bacterium 32-68-7]|nr:MAG: hypothetical protein B7Z33_12940 [Sphingomonadales bacterium 12-68-11]OYX07348.1 MAG: hypothetical protein B7Z08_12565 [Sphingomonadales bacterium 32-68-7]
MRFRPFPALLAGAGLACLALSGCVAPPQSPPPAPAPAPAPPPAPTPAPAPPPVPPPFTGNWMDAPITPGNWRYTPGAATFGDAGAPLLALRCDRVRGMITIARTGGAPDPLAMTVRTEFTDRSLQTVVQGGALVAAVSAGDAILDAMAFSKGRFAVEMPGLPALYVPSWPEVLRVIEDCR